ncbi:cytochrome C oxidase subunit IV family protein [Ureibacillus acetophenoni]|uniref:Cytochrome c oxidase subunit 4 n=1 Tax=Ureibacillus acetophenoni TaxID=614649 RepID=A0A285U0P9_9BACL|nr:cytochrome C oxidase subunit IV family protein [Ureibacillus acetophenoni]SOC35287.1 cytochrome c oxidase subunit 4 [Ureibacillus acetophenoni]
MGHDTHIHEKSVAQHEFDRRKNAVEMRKQVVNFAIMILFTFIAFAVVVADFSPYFIKPFILLLAAVQVVLQLYAFMHMGEKHASHIGTINTFVWVGAIIAFTVFLCFLTIIWW